MDQSGEAGALVAHQSAIPLFDLGHADRTQEDVARDRFISLGACEDGRIVGKSAQQFRPVIEETLDFPRGARADGLLRPGVDFAAEGAGVDDDQMADCGHIVPKAQAVMFTVRPPSTTIS
jgi:hypothetical protein